MKKESNPPPPHISRRPPPPPRKVTFEPLIFREVSRRIKGERSCTAWCVKCKQAHELDTSNDYPKYFSCCGYNYKIDRRGNDT